MLLTRAVSWIILIWMKSVVPHGRSRDESLLSSSCFNRVQALPFSAIILCGVDWSTVLPYAQPTPTNDHDWVTAFKSDEERHG